MIICDSRSHSWHYQFWHSGILTSAPRTEVQFQNPGNYPESDWKKEYFCVGPDIFGFAWPEQCCLPRNG